MHTFTQKPKAAAQQTTFAKSTIPNRGHFGQSRKLNSILDLQRTIGNQAVQRFLQFNTEDIEVEPTGTVRRDFAHDFSRIPVCPRTPSTIQKELTVNTPGDVYEQEADRVAEQVMVMPARTIVSGAPPCIQCVSRQSNRQADTAPASVDRVLVSPGRSLEPALRQDMEQRFGHDFSRVRVHSGAVAEQSAQDVNAHAYTVGHNIVFGAGRFAPGTHEGRRLIAHELTHTIQQVEVASSGRLTVQPPLVHAKLKIGRPDDEYEQEADRVAERVMNMPEPRRVDGSEQAKPSHIQRSCPKCKKGEQYQPSALSKDGLLAHELAHVVQQSSSTLFLSRPTSVDTRHKAAERKLEHMTERALTDLPIAISHKTDGILQLYGHDTNTCMQEDLEGFIWQGNDLAIEMVDDAIAALNINPRPEFVTKLFERYFMIKDPSVNDIKRNFNVLKSRFSSSDYFYTCRNDCASTTTHSTMGMTAVSRLFGGSGPIVLCVNNLRTAMNKRNAAARAIIHEFAHRYLNFYNETYCDQKCEGLDSNGALKNPDSYSYFAYEAHENKILQSIKSSRSPKP